VTQVGRHTRWTEAPDAVLRDPTFQREHFVLARSTVGWPEGAEFDLFARL
jgi:hypothetical protein